MANRFDSVEKRMEFNAPEKYFEYKMDLIKRKYINYGLHSGFGRIDRFVRNTPDYIVQGKNPYNNNPHFVEVKGSRCNFKIKVNDYREYVKWNKIMPLDFYFFSYEYEEGKSVGFDKIQEKQTLAETGVYDDNNEEYFIVKWSDV